MGNLLELKNVSKQYANFCLQNVSFEVPAGYIMGFVGANGAGKTTTINLILNAMSRDKGEIKVFGKDNIQEELWIKQRLGIVFDNIFFVKEWNLLDVEKAYEIFFEKWDSKKYRAYLEKFSLLPQTKVKDLSRGMGVKLLLAAALSHDAKLLILDEPTSGLDPAARDELMTLFQEYIEDGTRSILFSTHITTDLEKIADYITCIHQGKVYYTGPTEELLASYRVIKGAPDDYKAYEPYMIGARKFSTGFEGLVLKDNFEKLDQTVMVENPTIDDIIIYTTRGGKKHGR